MADTRIKQFVKEAVELLQTDFCTVYHYTSLISSQKILETRTLISTDIRSLNDSSELKHGLDFIYSFREKYKTMEFDHAHFLFKQKLSNRYPSNNSLKIEKTIIKTQHEVEALFQDTLNKAKLYVSSFCEKPDHYLAWLLYADKGEGVSIGFKSSFFESNIQKLTLKEQGGIFAQAFYKQLDYEENLLNLINLFKKYLNKATNFEVDEDFIFKIIGLYGAIIVGFASSIKHLGYEDEKEYRFIIDKDEKNLTGEEQKKYYTDDSFIQRTKLMTFEPSDIETVYFGPCMTKDRQERIEI
jgi:hypothetical protein